MIHCAGVMLVEKERYAGWLAEPPIGEADAVGVDVLGWGSLVRVVHYDRPCYSVRFGQSGEACFGAVDVVLHRGCSTDPDSSDNFSIHLDRKPAPIRRHPRKRRDAGQERRIALDEVEEVLRGDAEQSCISLVLCNLGGKDRGTIHSAEGFEIAAVIDNSDVLTH